MKFGFLLAVPLLAGAFFAGGALAGEEVTLDNFARAETDFYMKTYASAYGAFGKLFHTREPTPVDRQDVIRMNLDTLYSGGVFDMSNPVTFVMPEIGGRFQSMLVLNQDHYVVAVEHDPGTYTFDRGEVGTRYLVVIFRTFVDAGNPDDIKAVNDAQNMILAKQDDPGALEIPDWDRESHIKVRNALIELASTLPDFSESFGTRDEVNPVHHLVASAAAWGGNPEEAATYLNRVPERNNGKLPHFLTVKDVPVDGFWSVALYNGEGYMVPNKLNAYSYNNVTAKPNNDGSITIHFGACDDGRVNCLPVMEGWNYIVRLYQPRKELLDGSWTFPEAKPIE